jgi:DNA repair exonuclease SbcCD ATPase subunit
MMHQQGPDLEQRLSKLEAQLDRFSLTLHQWQQTQKHLQPMESRLSELIEQSSDVLNRWTATDQRHAQAVGEVQSRLNDWNAIETRLGHDANQRIQEFEQSMQHELSALRQLHEEPVKQLREQAANLGEICASATSSVTELERTEARFAALEADLHVRLDELARGLQAVVAELRGGGEHRTAALTETAPAWPLDDVVRLHDGLRRSSQGSDPRPSASRDGASERAAASSAPLQLPEAAAALAGRVESLEHALTTGREEVAQAADRSERQRRLWSVAFAVLALGVVGAGALAFGLQRRVDTKLNEAAARVTAAQHQAEAAAQLANQRVAATREDADRKIAEAEQTARNAQTVSDVLAAPDLVRFNVTSSNATPRAYAQMLWSRSRGLVFSGSRVPPAPAGTTYQAWLLTSAEPVSAGLFVPDAAGRVMLVAQDPPKVPRAVLGVAVTLEPTGGRPAPSGPTFLARAP